MITTGTKYTPSFSLKANNKDVTKAVLERMISLTVNYYKSGESASLNLQLADYESGKRVVAPEQNDKIELKLGYEDAVTEMGTFVIDSVSLSGGVGSVDTITITGKAINTSSKIFDRQYKVWKPDKEGGKLFLKDIVNKIAKKHKLKGKVCTSLLKVEIEREIQRRESDISFLRYLAEKNKALISFYKKDLSMVEMKPVSVSGTPIKPQIVSPTEIFKWNLKYGNRWDYKKIIVEWWDDEKALMDFHEEINKNAGDGINKEYLSKRIAGSKDEAKMIAKSELKKLNDSKDNLSLNIIGNAEIGPLTPIVISGVRNHVDGKWLVGDVTHSLSSSGFTTNLTNMDKLK